MDSPPRFPSVQLPQPDNEQAIERTFRGYAMALSRMKVPELLEHLTMINATIERDRRERMAKLLSQPPSASSSIDDLVVRSTTSASRSPSASDRPSPRQNQTRPPELTPLDRWAKQRSLGRSLAARLAAADIQRRRSSR